MRTVDDVLACTLTDLSARLEAGGRLARWAHAEPCLARYPNIRALVSAASDRDQSNEIHTALARLASIAGMADDEALLLLLHLLAGFIVQVSGQIHHPHDEVSAMLIAEITCSVRERRWAGTNLVAVSLLRHARREVLAELANRSRRHRRVEPPAETYLPPEIVEDLAGGVEPHEDLDLVDLCVWAVAQGVPADDVRLLVDSERRRDGGGGDSATAAAWGIAVRTVLRRRERTLGRLRQLAPDYLRDVA